MISTQHAVPNKVVRSKECAGYTGKEMTAPIMEEMNKLIVSELIVKTLQVINLKNGKPAVTLDGEHTHLHVACETACNDNMVMALGEFAAGAAGL